MYLDENWFNYLRDNLQDEVLEWLRFDVRFLQEQKNSFFAKKIDCPEFKYVNCNTVNIAELIARVQGMRLLLQQKEQNEIIRDIYLAKLDEIENKYRIVQSAWECKWDEFMNGNMVLYGENVEEYFNLMASDLVYKMDKLSDCRLKSKWSGLRRLLGGFESKKMWRPSKIEQSVVLRDLLDKCDISKYLKNRKYDARKICEIFRKVLIDLNMNGWRVSVRGNSQRITISVDVIKKTINIPKSKMVSKIRLRKLIGHEIVTHVMRSENGGLTRLKLLSIGLGNYLKGEEGVAVVRSQAWNRFRDYSASAVMLGVGLCIGLTGKKMDFRQVYKYLEQYFLCKFAFEEKDGSRYEMIAKDLAWNVCIRIFRGTTGKDKGVCSMKGVVYFEGNFEVWKRVQNDPRSIAWFDIGKFDINNDRHVDWLKKMKILSK